MTSTILNCFRYIGIYMCRTIADVARRTSTFVEQTRAARSGADRIEEHARRKDQRERNVS